MSERADGGRFPLLAPDSLADAQRTVYDAVASPPRGDGPFLVVDDDGHLAGPFNALLYSPNIGLAVQALGTALRFGGTLPGRTRELVICAVAAELNSDYEWYAHSRVALSVGVSSAELESVRSGRTPDAIGPGEQAALSLAIALLRDRVVGTEVHAAALEFHGHSGVVELAVLVGYYQTLAGLLTTADVFAPTDSIPQITRKTKHPTTSKGEHP